MIPTPISARGSVVQLDVLPLARLPEFIVDDRATVVVTGTIVVVDTLVAAGCASGVIVVVAVLFVGAVPHSCIVTVCCIGTYEMLCNVIVTPDAPATLVCTPGKRVYDVPYAVTPV
jgi:hypothetical protein